MSDHEFIAVNWGSSNLAAHLISPASGLIDAYRAPKGIARLDRDGIASTLSEVVARWPGGRPIYVSGMIGSNVGWIEAPYLKCPARLIDCARSMVQTRIGALECHVVPGLQSSLPNGDPDVLRGEEMEIFGALAADAAFGTGDFHLVLPGTHTKWVRVSDGRVVDFFTSMGGDMFDSMSSKSLLSSVLLGDGADDSAYRQGVQRALQESTALPRLLFGVRARVLTGRLQKHEAAGYARGLIIGTELADALQVYPTMVEQERLPLLGNPDLCRLYARAMELVGMHPQLLDPARPLVGGYIALHEAITGCAA